MENRKERINMDPYMVRAQKRMERDIKLDKLGI